MSKERIKCARGRRRGGIRFIRNGVWEIRWSHGVDPETGRRRRYTRRIYGTKKDAERSLTSELKRIDDGRAPKRSRRTLDSWLKEHFDVWCFDVSPRTLHGYRQAIRAHVPDRLLRKRLGSLTDTDLQALFNQMIERGLSVRTVHGTRAALRRALNVAIERGLIETNVASKVKLPKLPKSRPDVLTLEEIDRFIDAAVTDRWYALWALLVTTGLRPGEAFGLKWSDWNGNRLRVARALVRVPGQPWTLGPTKTRTSRSVSLSKLAIRALRNHRSAQARERLQVGPVYEDHDLIFALSTGAPIDLNNLRKKHFTPLLDRAGLRPIRVYDLRHSAATAQLAKGANPKVVAEMLGHASVHMTLNTYAHVTPDMQEQTAAMWDARYG